MVVGMAMSGVKSSLSESAGQAFINNDKNSWLLRQNADKSISCHALMQVCKIRMVEEQCVGPDLVKFRD